jgi:hypothetical protein
MSGGGGGGCWRARGGVSQAALLFVWGRRCWLLRRGGAAVWPGLASRQAADTALANAQPLQTWRFRARGPPRLELVEGEVGDGLGVAAAVVAVGVVGEQRLLDDPGEGFRGGLGRVESALKSIRLRRRLSVALKDANRNPFFAYRLPFSQHRLRLCTPSRQTTTTPARALRVDCPAQVPRPTKPPRPTCRT